MSLPDQQMPLDLTAAPTYQAADFLVAASNAEAHGWIARWPAWPGFALALVGPAGSGKTHLAHIFAARAQAPMLDGAHLTAELVPDLAAAPAVVIEDADRGANPTALLHLYNLLREGGRFLLLTGRRPPAQWRVALPDLASRLATLPLAALGPPDEDLLKAVLLKLWSDRQVRVETDVLDYVAARMERSFAAAGRLVAAIDRAALTAQRPITIPLARVVMARDASDPAGEESHD